MSNKDFQNGFALGLVSGGTVENKDNLTTLAEGLSTATSIKDVQEAAKNILESEKI